MATKVTYAQAIDSIVKFAKDNGYDDIEVLNKMEVLFKQKATKNTTNGKSKARVENERIAQTVADEMRNRGINEIRAAWVKDNIVGVNTVPKAVAVLNAATDAGILKQTVIAKSATRNELVYTLPTE